MSPGLPDTACKQHPDRVGGVQCQRCGEPMCPSCMNPASVGWHCPNCVKGHRRQARPVEKAVTRAMGQSPPIVTQVIVAACAAVFVYDIATGANALTGSRAGGGASQVWRDFSLFAPSVEYSNEWYRVFTSAFIHSGLIHIGFNMWLLWVVGQSLEGRFGSLTFATMYATGIVGGSLGAMLLQPQSAVGGASGAVFALMGILVVLQRMGGVNIFQSGIGGLVLINVLLSFRSGVSFGGHLGGLAVGLAMGALLGWARKTGPKAEALVPVAIAGMGLLMMLALIPVMSRAAGTF